MSRLMVCAWTTEIMVAAMRDGRRYFMDAGRLRKGRHTNAARDDGFTSVSCGDFGAAILQQLRKPLHNLRVLRGNILRLGHICFQIEQLVMVRPFLAALQDALFDFLARRMELWRRRTFDQFPRSLPDRIFRGELRLEQDV